MNTTTQPDTNYRITLEGNNFMGRIGCSLCGGSIEDARFVPTLHGPDDEKHDVCLECLAAGPTGIAGRILAHAQRQEEFATAILEWVTQLRDLPAPPPSSWSMPALEEWANAQIAGVLHGHNEPSPEGDEYAEAVHQLIANVRIRASMPRLREEATTRHIHYPLAPTTDEPLVHDHDYDPATEDEFAGHLTHSHPGYYGATPMHLRVDR